MREFIRKGLFYAIDNIYVCTALSYTILPIRSYLKFYSSSGRFGSRFAFTALFIGFFSGSQLSINNQCHLQFSLGAHFFLLKKEIKPSILKPPFSFSV